MPPRLTVPSLLLALCAPASGCVDPIVGEWEYDGAGGYIEDYFEGLDVEGVLVIDEDLEGEFELTMSDGESDYDYESDLEVTVEDDEYEIEFEEGGEEAICVIEDGDRLECEYDDGGEMYFERVK